MQPGQPPDVDPSVREALALALTEVGCPSETAREISHMARLERTESYEGEPTTWLLVLESPAFDRGVDYSVSPEDIEPAVEQLARGFHRA